ncbi:S41 family peptidase [Vallitalea okinawensis]|uniref:S41 family peptidase n=1 Tax=Vallitalea okinawensis TaxID=2078660 RepID=UPI00130044ED|nr:S41 family peptidase [Vallitalea okinawensis]
MYNKRYKFGPRLNYEQKYRKLKRKFIILTLFLLLIILCGGIYIYKNYNYLAFKYVMTDHYVYTETMDQMFNEQLNLQITEEEYDDYFDYLVIEVMSNEIQKTNNDRYTYLYTPNAYEQMKIYEEEEANESYFETINEDTVFLSITNFSKYTEKYIKKNKEELNSYPYLILDLRNNGGGDVFSLYDIADLFLPEDTIISSNITRSDLLTRDMMSNGKPYFDFEHIVILQDEGTASASESFIVALKDHLANVTLIGSTTFGKGIGQFTLPLTDGYAFKATTMYWEAPNGYSIHQSGIQPDVIHSTDESIIDYAEMYIKNTVN